MLRLRYGNTTQRATGTEFGVPGLGIAIGLLASSVVMANNPVRIEARQFESLQLIADPVQHDELQLEKVKRIKSARLLPLVENMAMNATNETAECALALLSIDRKLRLQHGADTGNAALGKAGKKAADLCGVPYAPCVDAKIERKLLEDRNRWVRRQADRKVSVSCAT